MPRIFGADQVKECGRLVRRDAVPEFQADDLSSIESLNIQNLEPWIVRSICPGPCIWLWNLKYLESRIGPRTNISVHQGTCRNLQFYPEKNFAYKTCAFSELRAQAEAGAHVYLRSLASTSPFQKPANLWDDFPTIAEDFRLPELLIQKFQLEHRIHSSVLRLSGNVAVWLHYDVMSNFLFQIHGSKTVILYPPTSAVALQFAPGSTTSPVSIENIEASVLREQDSLLLGLKGRAIVLNPGDVLFIPRFWPHATLPADGELPVAVAVNVFWRDLETKNYAAGRDVYGSRDLGVYENGRKSIKRVADRLTTEYAGGQQRDNHVSTLARYLNIGIGFEKLDLNVKLNSDIKKLRTKLLELPKDVGAFYLPRLAQELVLLCRTQNESK